MNTAGANQAIQDRIAVAAKLGFADDEVRNSMTTLVGATHDLTQALNIQNVAMDLARFKGITLQEASDALTTIEAGRARGLAALGINVKDYATTAERLAAVEKVANGQAADFADTLAGKLAVSAVKAKEAMEGLGKDTAGFKADFEAAKADALDKFVTGLDYVTDSINFSSQSMQRQLEILYVQRDGFAKGTVAYNGYTDAINKLQRQLSIANLDLDHWNGKLLDDVANTQKATAAAATYTAANGDLAASFRDLAGAVGTAGSALGDQLFGGVQDRGKKADLLTQYDALKKKLAGTHGKERDSLLGQIGAVEQALFDLDLKMAESAGPDALIKFLDQSKLHAKGLTQAELDAVDALKLLAEKQKIAAEIFAPGGGVYTGANPLGTHRAPGQPAPGPTQNTNLPPPPIWARFPWEPVSGPSAQARRPTTQTQNINLKVSVTAANGIITPGTASSIANQIGPYLMRYFQRHGLAPNSAGARGQAAAL